MKSSELNKEFLRELRQQISEPPFEMYRKYGFFLKELNKNSLAEISLLNTLGRGSDGWVDVNAIVGICYFPIENVLHELDHEPLGKPPLRTICANVGYYSPEDTYVTVQFHLTEQIDESVKEVLELIRLYALPAFEKYQTLDGVIEALQNKSIWPPLSGGKHLAVAHALQGDYKEARAIAVPLLKHYKKLAEKQGHEQTYATEFGERLVKWIDEKAQGINR